MTSTKQKQKEGKIILGLQLGVFSTGSSNPLLESEVRNNVLVGACIGSRMRQEGTGGQIEPLRAHTYLVTTA